MNKTVPYVLLAICLSTGCGAKRPVLFDNAAYTKNPAKADAAIDDCMAKGKAKGLEGNRLAKAGESAAKSGIASGAAGAAGSATANGILGAHRYSVGASAGASAASGAAGSLALGLMDNSVDEGMANYVSLCLSQRGYKVVTWR